MIHVNVRGLLVREKNEKLQLVIQLRKREGEPEVYELPGGRINEYESMADGLKREVMEETGLKVIAIENEDEKIVTQGMNERHSFSIECIRPYAAYQTIHGPVDSFGVYFICQVEGEVLKQGDDTAKIHWANLSELENLVKLHMFSEIDLPALLLFLKEHKDKM